MTLEEKLFAIARKRQEVRREESMSEGIGSFVRQNFETVRELLKHLGHWDDVAGVLGEAGLKTVKGAKPDAHSLRSAFSRLSRSIGPAAVPRAPEARVASRPTGPPDAPHPAPSRLSERLAELAPPRSSCGGTRQETCSGIGILLAKESKNDKKM